MALIASPNRFTVEVTDEHDAAKFKLTDPQQRHRILDRLRHVSPAAMRVYEALRDKEFFWTWVKKDDPPAMLAQNLQTAVHESLHSLRQDMGNSILAMDGSRLQLPGPARRMMELASIADRFRRAGIAEGATGDGSNFQTYVRRGAASSAIDFSYLLDEFNAYIYDRNIAEQLNSAFNGGGSGLNPYGVVSMMAFVGEYAAAARQTNPETWKNLTDPAVAKTVATLWQQGLDVAERALAAHGEFPTDNETRVYAGMYKSPDVTRAMTAIAQAAGVALAPPSLDQAASGPASLRIARAAEEEPNTGPLAIADETARPAEPSEMRRFPIDQPEFAAASDETTRRNITPTRRVSLQHEPVQTDADMAV